MRRTSLHQRNMYVIPHYNFITSSYRNAKFDRMISSLETMEKKKSVELRDDRSSNQRMVHDPANILKSPPMSPKLDPKRMLERIDASFEDSGPGVISRPLRVHVLDTDDSDGKIRNPPWDPWIKSPLGKANRELLSSNDDWVINNYSQQIPCCGSSSVTTVSYSADEISTFTDSDETRITSNDVKDCSTITTDFGSPTYDSLKGVATTANDLPESPNSFQSGMSSCTRYWPPPPSTNGMTYQWLDKDCNLSDMQQRVPIKSEKHCKSTLNPCTKSFQPMAPDSPFTTPQGICCSYNTPSSAATFPLHPYYVPQAGVTGYTHPSIYTNYHSCHMHGYQAISQYGNQYNYQESDSPRRKLFQAPKPHYQQNQYAFNERTQIQYGYYNPNCFRY